MSEIYRFFNNEVEDPREYQASEFSEYFSKFLNDGICSVDETMGLDVEVVSGLTIKVGVGFAFIDGYMYENDDDLEFTLSTADTTLNRIDRIVLRLDTVNRVINLKLLEGSYSSSPSPEDITYTDTIKEITIAQLKVNKNVTVPTITDERIPVSSLIEIPYADMVEEFDTWFEAKQLSVGSTVYSSDTEPGTIVTGDLWLKELS